MFRAPLYILQSTWNECGCWIPWHQPGSYEFEQMECKTIGATTLAYHSCCLFLLSLVDIWQSSLCKLYWRCKTKKEITLWQLPFLFCIIILSVWLLTLPSRGQFLTRNSPMQFVRVTTKQRWAQLLLHVTN